MVTIEELKRLELITAKILDVQDHPDADRLYVLNIDTGTEEKQLVAGIRKSYTKEELIGRTIIVINNLQPAVIRGQESNGMLLAVGDEKGISLLCTDR
ncbi:MAG: methionine--tRNA ligase, partial [Candidatus Scalindua sp.]